MKLYVDDIREAPDGYKLLRTTNETIDFIKHCEEEDSDKIELIDIDHDAGDYEHEGGDYIKVLDWLEETGRNYPIHIHSMNPVGVQNMRAIIQRNGWTEIL